MYEGFLQVDARVFLRIFGFLFDEIGLRSVVVLVAQRIV